MTAVIVVRDKKAAHVVTDMGVFDADGRLGALCTKVAHLPHLNAVVAMRGHNFHFPLVSQALAFSGKSFEDLKRTIGEMTKDILSTTIIGVYGHVESAFEIEIAVAGIDKNGNADSYLICSHDRYGFAPFTIFDPGQSAIFLPGDQEMIGEIHSQAVEQDRDGRIDMAAFSRRAMEIQRRKKWPTLSGHPLRQVGGAIQLTTVEKDLISSRIIHRWPDEIGKAVDSA